MDMPQPDSAYPYKRAPAAEMLPSDLLELPRWVVWKLIKRDRDKPTKVPYCARPGRKGRKASVVDPETWATFAQARAAFDKGGYSGLGFVLGAGIVGVDLDHCYDPATDALTEEAQAIIAALATYTEYSPSGTGVHLLMRGALPSGGRHGAQIELYETDRFFTVSGQQLPNTPRALEERTEALAALHARVFPQPEPASQPEPAPRVEMPMDDAAIVQRAMRAKNGADFARLFRGDTTGQGNDASRADFALVGFLRFYTGGDPVQMDRIFRQSGLMRDKWDERHAGDGTTYGAMTIARALNSGPYSVWTPRGEVRRAPPVVENGPTAATEDADDLANADETDDGKRSQAGVLVSIAETAELFTTPDRMAHARAYVNGHYETWALGEKGGGFRRWLVHEYHALYQRAPNPQALTQALEVIVARAIFDGPVHRVHIRLAEHDGMLYHDLGDDQWRSVAISAEGWGIVTNPPVYFRRPRGMAALPLPESGGSLDELLPLIGPQSDAEWMLICAWLVGTFHPRGPYTHLSVNGHAGAGKSTKTRMLRTLIDPSQAPTRGDPKDERDLAVAAHNNRILALDNLSYMPSWLSDFLCQLSTGSGRGYRSLYSDDEETIFDAKRPVIFNGIEDVATRGDLLDRTISVTLARIPDDQRMSEDDLEAQFSAAHPRILGALYDIVACALRNRDTVRLAEHPRMADFARWIAAASPALDWEPAEFLTIYASNREAGIANELDASPVAAAVTRLMRDIVEWVGEAKDLYERLTPLAGDAIVHTKVWPSSPRGLSGALKRLAPALLSGESLIVEHFRETSRTSELENGRRYIRLSHRPLVDDANDDANAK